MSNCIADTVRKLFHVNRLETDDDMMSVVCHTKQSKNITNKNTTKISMVSRI